MRVQYEPALGLERRKPRFEQLRRWYTKSAESQQFAWQQSTKQLVSPLSQIDQYPFHIAMLLTQKYATAFGNQPFESDRSLWTLVHNRQATNCALKESIKGKVRTHPLADLTTLGRHATGSNSLDGIQPYGTIVILVGKEY